MLQVSNVSKSFSDNLVFERVSFTLNYDERVGLVDPSGFGKTTLLKTVLGELAPDTSSFSDLDDMRRAQEAARQQEIP